MPPVYCSMPDERASMHDVLCVREGYQLWAGQCEQGGVIREHLLGILGRERGGVLQQIVFHLLADDLRQHHPTNAGGAEREHRFIQAPGRDNAARQDVRIQKQPQRAGLAHPRCLRVRGRSWAAICG